MNKKTAFGARPKRSVEIPPEAEKFVQGGAEQSAHPPPPPEKTEKVKAKRLTIDIEPTLHKRLKAKAANEETTIADVARQLLEEWVAR